jgi:hypothetical protein
MGATQSLTLNSTTRIENTSANGVVLGTIPLPTNPSFGTKNDAEITVRIFGTSGPSGRSDPEGGVKIVDSSGVVIRNIDVGTRAGNFDVKDAFNLILNASRFPLTVRQYILYPSWTIDKLTFEWKMVYKTGGITTTPTPSTITTPTPSTITTPTPSTITTPTPSTITTPTPSTITTPAPSKAPSTAPSAVPSSAPSASSDNTTAIVVTVVVVVVILIVIGAVLMKKKKNDDKKTDSLDRQFLIGPN